MTTWVESGAKSLFKRLDKVDFPGRTHSADKESERLQTPLSQVAGGFPVTGLLGFPQRAEDA